MDQKDNNQSMDGMKPNDQQAFAPGVDGFVTPPRQIYGSKTVNVVDENIQENDQNQQLQPQTKQKVPLSDIDRLKKSNKRLKVWLAIFVIIVAAATAGLVVYYYQNNKTQDDLNAAKTQNAKLVKESSDQQKTSSQQQVDTLNAQIKTLESTISSQETYITSLTTYITSLTKVAQQLKTTCGTPCSAIVIPPPPAAPAPTTAPSTTNP